MKTGDIVIFYNNSDIYRETKCIIKKITKYNNFKEYLLDNTIKNCLPTIENTDDGVDIYYKYYTKEDESKYGCVAIEIEQIRI